MGDEFAAPDESTDEDRVWTELELRLATDRQRGELLSVAQYERRYRIDDAGRRMRLRALHRSLLTDEPQAQAAPPFEQVGPYRLGEQIGAGGQARVFVAQRAGLDSRFALKLLDARLASPASQARFRREMQAASRLDHQGLCRVHDHGEHEGFWWLAMSYVPGETLARRLAQQRSLPVDEALPLFEQIAMALQHAHDRGIVHRDVKPGNLMIHADDGRAVLVDFGIAVTLDADALRQTRQGQIVGTRCYLSPEQVLGLDADARTDVWSLGVTMFESLTGRVPFDAPTDAALHERIRNERPPALDRADVPRDLAIVVATAMEKERCDRYESAAALAADLRRVRRREPIAARPVGPLRRLLLWSRRNRGWAATIATATCLLIAVTVLATVAALRAERMRHRSAQLAGKPSLEALVEQARQELLAPIPARIPRFEQWLERAHEMLREAPRRRDELEQLRTLAEPRDDLDLERDREHYALEHANMRLLERELAAGPLSAERAAYRRRVLEQVAFPRHFTFGDYELQIQHDALCDYVIGLQRLAEPTVAHAHTVAALEHRLATARRLEERLAGEDSAAWAWCRRYLRDTPAYEGVSMEPIPGLVPLGCDSTSGLLEFWHVTSGARPEWIGTPLGTGRVAPGDGTEAGLVLVLLPGGTFRMGTERSAFGEMARRPNSFARALSDESPVHDVQLAPFLLSKFEVTCAQYERAFGPKRTVVGEALRARHPQAWLSWDEAELACRSWDLTLPTEAQWEYACRATTGSPFSCGWHWRSLRGFANFGGDTGTRPENDDGFAGPAPVGSFGANGFGLFDMHGNVGEWCLDAAQPYAEWPARAGDGLRAYVVGMAERGLRGGSFAEEPWELRSGRRWRQRPTYTASTLGFRPARSLRVQR